MKTSFDILARLYPVLNVTSVTTLFSTGGRVYRRKPPVNSHKKEISIGTLPVPDARESDVQDGTALVNIHCPNFDDGTPDETSLKAMTDIVVTKIEAYTPTAGEFCTFKIISENLMQDMDDDKMSYVSLRVNYHIEV